MYCISQSCDRFLGSLSLGSEGALFGIQHRGAFQARVIHPGVSCAYFGHLKYNTYMLDALPGKQVDIAAKAAASRVTSHYQTSIPSQRLEAMKFGVEL